MRIGKLFVCVLILILAAALCIACTHAEIDAIFPTQSTTETVPETQKTTVPAATKPLTYDGEIDFSQLPDGTTPPTKPTEPKPTKPETDEPTTTPTTPATTPTTSTTPTEKPEVPETETTKPTDAPPAATESDGYQSVVVRP